MSSAFLRARLVDSYVGSTRFYKPHRRAVVSSKRVGMPDRFEFLTNGELRITWDDADLEVAVLVALLDQNVARGGGLFCHGFCLQRNGSDRDAGTF